MRSTVTKIVVNIDFLMFIYVCTKIKTMNHYDSLVNMCTFFYILQFVKCDQVDVIFTFKEYPYKDSPKNEMTFREFETACEQSAACSQMSDLIRTRCIRECVSPSCYKELYSLDPLEEGEIDVRLNSFKGCFVQRSGRTRN